MCADKPGRSFDSRGQGRHSLSTEQQATGHLAEQFAKHLSALLDDGRHQQRNAKLVLVAEPRFLGSLRAALSSPTAALVTATLGKGPGRCRTAQHARVSGRNPPALATARVVPLVISSRND
ncbi:MAG: host attachment protein [Gammaproteobacteria bacterium]|nr:host attachment protein [Gammaproteobacteria bacterium]